MTNDNAAPASEPAIPNPRADIAQLDALERTLYCHRYAIDEISSLGPVIDPAKATAERGEAVALLEQERVEALCAPEVGPLLGELRALPGPHRGGHAPHGPGQERREGPLRRLARRV